MAVGAANWNVDYWIRRTNNFHRNPCNVRHISIPTYTLYVYATTYVFIWHFTLTQNVDLSVLQYSQYRTTARLILFCVFNLLINFTINKENKFNFIFSFTIPLGFRCYGGNVRITCEWKLGHFFVAHRIRCNLLCTCTKLHHGASRRDFQLNFNSGWVRHFVKSFVNDRPFWGSLVVFSAIAIPTCTWNIAHGKFIARKLFGKKIKK